MWDSFDKRQNAKAEPIEVANEDMGAGVGDMFARARMAAE